MTAYNPLYVEYPTRLLDFWSDHIEHEIEIGEREVSITLAIIGTAVLAPLERLGALQTRPDHELEDPTQSSTSSARHILRQLIDAQFIGSPLWQDGPCSWRFGKRLNRIAARNIWNENEAQSNGPSTLNWNCGQVLRVMRNASAHANIDVESDHDGQISRVALMNFPTNGPGFDFLIVSPAELVRFVHNWRAYIAGIKAQLDLAVERTFALAA